MRLRTTAMGGKTVEWLEEVDEMIRQHHLHAMEWHELLRRARDLAHRIEDRVRRAIELRADEKARPDGISNRANDLPV
jgi:hypothetical protein